MFDLFRSRAKAVRYLLGAILMLVALSLVITLIPGFGTDIRSERQVVAEFGGEPLTVMEVHQAIQVQIRNRAFSPELASVYAPQLINRMIAENAVAYESQRRGFEVSSADVARTIQTIFPNLYEDGKFVGREVYASMLAQQNMTVAQFERNIRKQLLINKLRGMVLDGVVVTSADVEREFRVRNEKAKIEYVALDPAKFRSEVRVSPEEVQAFFEKNRPVFNVPEKRNIDVLVLDETQIAQSVIIPEADLRRAYDSQKDSFRVPERVKVRHILLTTTQKPQDEIPRITAKANALLKQVRQGADFAELARKNSEDPGSAPKGGDLDWVVRGQTVPAFEQAAFSMKPGEISNVITTQYGLHIIQVLDRQDAHLQSFDEVKGRLAEELKRQAVYDRMQSLSDQTRAALGKDPAGAARISKELGLPLIKAEKIGPGEAVPGLGGSKELDEALATLRRGEVTPVVQIQPTKLAVAVVTEVFPARPAELADVESQIRQQLTDQKTMQMVAERARQALEKARSLGGDLRKTAQALGLEFKAPPEFTRDASVEGLGTASFVDEAFSVNVGTVFGPVNTGGPQFVCKLVQRIPADMSQFEAQRENLRQQLKSELARERMDLFEDGLVKQLVEEKKIKIHRDVISRIVSGYSGR